MADATRVHDCPVETCLEMLSGKWKPRILWKLHQHEVLRFNALRQDISGGISAKVLAQQLRDLERDGLVTRTAYPEVPPRVEYRLSPFGQSLGPVLDAIAGWGVAQRSEIVLRLEAADAPAAG